MGVIQIVIIDSHSLFANGLQYQLNGDKGLKCVAVASDTKEALHLVQENTPDVVLIDIASDGIIGDEICKSIKDISPQTATIILTHDSRGRTVMDFLKIGVDGYILKEQRLDYLVNAIRVVHGGGVIYDHCVNETILRSAGLLDTAAYEVYDLRSREMEVLRLAAEGMSYKEIAQSLNLSEHTIGSHFTNIYRKLGVQSRTEAVLHGIEQGWFSLGDSNRKTRENPTNRRT